MVQTIKRGLRRCPVDGSWGLEWDDLLPYVAMGYKMSKQKALGFSPYFLLYDRKPLFLAKIQHLEEEQLDPQEGSI